MRKNLFKLLGLCLVVATMATCTDHTPTAAPNDDAEAVAPTLGASHACDLVSQMTTDVRNYYPQPEKVGAQSTMRNLSNACGANNSGLVKQYALELLATMESVFNSGRGGDPVVGSRLANALLACATGGCTSAALPNVNLTTVLTPLGSGLFAVRAEGTSTASAHATARAPISFTFLGEQHRGWFGVELAQGATETWSEANGGTPVVLLYGYNPPAAVQSRDVLFGTLRYSFNRWPDTGQTFKRDGLVEVGTCFDGLGPQVPHLGDPLNPPHAKPRIQRETTVLASATINFCSSLAWPATASLMGPVRAVASMLLPRSWSAIFFGDIRTPVIGGSAYDFSNFAPVGVNSDGRFWILEGPASGQFFTVGQALNIKVLAASGAGTATVPGTPIERVPVEMYVSNNSGTPAGAYVVPDPNDTDATDGDGTWGFTVEDGGTVILTGGVNKPGGYIVCVRLRTDPGFAGFTFSEACTNQFQVKP